MISTDDVFFYRIGAPSAKESCRRPVLALPSVVGGQFATQEQHKVSSNWRHTTRGFGKAPGRQTLAPQELLNAE